MSSFLQIFLQKLFRHLTLKNKTHYRWIAASIAAFCLFPTTASAALKGDVNGDGIFSVADLVSFSQYILGSGELPKDPDAGNLYAGERLDVFDLILMRKELVNAPKTNIVRVTNTEELKTALANAKPRDEIVLAEGEYVYSGSTPMGRTFVGEADGTEIAPIILRSENPDNPSIISGTTMEHHYGLTILGDWWEIRDLKVTNASKGIIIDNSNHTKVINCEVYNTGTEGVHIRDNSSYCLVESCYIHDTGTITPKYGEGVYVGSSKSTTDYGHKCDYNKIRKCKIGPNVGAEHVDVKEYTTGTLIEYCTFDGKGMKGENYADSFVDLKGNDCILRYCTGYRNGETNINRAFEMNKLDEGWGQNAYIYSNKAYMDTPTNSQGKKMVFLNSWNCTETVWDNWIAYEDGELLSCDNEEDQWTYYNCNGLTYGDESMEENLPR